MIQALSALPESFSSSTVSPWRWLTTWSSLDSAAMDTLKKWATRNWQPGQGIVQKANQPTPEQKLWASEALRVSRQNGVAAVRARTWLNTQQPDSSDGAYPAIYPHRHAKEGCTVILYLQPGDSPASLEILTDDLEFEASVAPEVGKVVLLKNGVWHRVHKNRGTTDRIALIAEVYE